ncbi:MULTISPECIES: TetR/AcrR family transcriptional regulator [unclassified Pseudomonas]|uniref:TetR/AcrR family transcriptional regulator n=1 Tax=unclassified Pseudomonas TaxID=196821 RepID=UPI00244D523D|nr:MULTISPECIES: TetR/AcrR family transcriptional regulator [unclassified Pseudomonas]MDG9928990.1 TetR/AcrR family transcriptional regulator [Pseudomonas sp. GD04042]MDH0483841.1 TetR/AcrR family transcriptional regulator [Pseudomonas sp. GD04015]MDH0604316.1 TetR/AcrR family transcriptional regulator [Pseudomonas sp. GD03869]
MSRYSSDRAEITRREILESATELFRQHGVHEVSLAKIMSEVGMTPGGFYKYFDSKEVLAGEVCTRAFLQSHEVWEAIIDRARQRSECPQRALIREYLALAEDGHCPIIALSHDAAGVSHDQSFAQAYRDGSKGLLDALLEISFERKSGASRQEILALFAAMLGIGLLLRAASSEPWVKEIEGAFLSQLR